VAVNPPPTSWHRPVLITGSIVLVVASLYWAKAILIPLVLAILLTFILTPFVNALQRRGLGRVPSVILVVTLACLVVAGIGLAVLYQVESLADDLPHYKDQIVKKVTDLRAAGQDSWFDKLYGTVQEIIARVEQAEGPGRDQEKPTPVVVVSSGWSFSRSPAPPSRPW